MAQDTSNVFTMKVNPVVAPDGTVWLDGNGPTWENGTAGTFNALQALVNSINPTTGGWLPFEDNGSVTGLTFNTKLTPVLTTQAEVIATMAAGPNPNGLTATQMWGSGSSQVLEAWCAAVFTGKGFIIGPGGGHGAYGGVETYRYRITDPPAVVRMYKPPPIRREVSTGGWYDVDWDVDPGNNVGVQALHHYDAYLWDPTRQVALYGATSGQLRAFNPNAPTPKSAWTTISTYAQRNPGALTWGFPSFILMSADEMYFASDTSAGTSGAVNLNTGVRRSPARPPDPWANGMGVGVAYCYMRRASTASTSKVYWTNSSTATGVNRYHFRSFDPSTSGAGTFNTPNAGNILPASFQPISGGALQGAYRNIALATGAFGERVACYWAGAWPSVLPASGYAVCCWDPVANVVHEYTSTATPRPTGYQNGTLGWRFAYVPEVKAFLAITKPAESIWIFRPPASWGFEGSSGGTVTAQSASLAHVQAAVNAAVDGQTVLIPNGTVTWDGGITTTKQIQIRAQNYTPTPAGTSGAGTFVRNVTITNNSTTAPLFTFTSGNSFHVGLGGIKFRENVTSGVTSSAMQNHVRFTGSGSKVPLLFDCAFECGRPAGNQPAIANVALLSQGGVMWNCVYSGQGFSDPPTSPVGPINGCIYMQSPRAWTTPSTMGALDTGGLVNWYFEDCTLLIVSAAPDVDDHGRFVARRCVFDGVFGLTHGFTSLFGGRHTEYYDCNFINTFANRNNGNYFWFRAGTGIFTDCSVSNTNQGFGSPSLFMLGDNTSPGSYLMPRQPGCGHNGTSYVSDPIYVWNNTGGSAYAFGFNDQPGGWQSIVQQNRDFFVNNGAKPGYTKFTYPHPFRAAV